MTTALKTEKAIFCKPHYRKIQTSANLPAISELFSQLENPSILGANSSKINADKYSYWAARPKEIFEFQAGEKEPFKKLQQILDKYKLKKMDSSSRGNDKNIALPEKIFCGGWLGFFSYELGRYIEKLPQTTINDLQMPLIRLCFYDRLIAYDHKDNVFWLIALQLPNEVETPRKKLDCLEKLLLESQKINIPEFASTDLDNIDLPNIKCNMSKDYYLQTIEKIKTYIYDGDVYQVNFSQRFDCNFNSKPIELFHWQNRYNPSPYAGYIGGDNFQIVSTSPEMFLTINDCLISTKPIKGTRPRVNKSIQDAKNFKELLESEKEKAEINMIIDLERNDIAKICQAGTRKVIQQRTIESHPTVFHAVATIAGKLKNKTTICDILKAVFPGGSITGAPKIRSMEIIDETEPTERGVYTGSIGFIGIDGNVCLNIAIRTIIIRAQKAFVQVGGGIVADSQPQAEWDETITKAKALLAGIKSVEQTG